VPWDRSVTDLADCGWSLVESAVGFGQIERLAAKDGSRWVLLEDEGVARQHGFGTYMPFDSAQPAVRQLGIDLVLGLSRAAERRQLPAVPEFNEVSWTRYPAHQGMITRHRDFREYGGIIAVITLQGSSVFRVYDSPIDAVEWH